VLSGAATMQALADAWADVPPRLYLRSQLIDIHGQPIKLAHLARETNYVFHYPYASTPCFLLKLPPRSVTRTRTLTREDGQSYAWNGGVGPERAVVAFSAICAHKLAYPRARCPSSATRRIGRRHRAAR
jgi:Rieske Fe-S protein